jgi:hypothetical protein
MKGVALSLVCVLAVLGCSATSEEDAGPAGGPPPAPPVTTAATPTDQQRQDAAAAEASLHSLGVPIYAGATVDATQHCSADPGASNAVFTTPATPKQVEYFYDSFPELKPQSANGSTVYSGNLLPRG